MKIYNVYFGITTYLIRGIIMDFYHEGVTPYNPRFKTLREIEELIGL